MDRRTSAAAAAVLALLTGCSAGSSAAAPTPAASALAPTGAAAPTADSSAPTDTTPPAASTATAPPTTAPPTSAAPAGTVIELAYRGGQVTGDTGRVAVPAGQPVTLRVTSDVVEQVHVHGVDRYLDLEPARPATLQFSAPPPGIYEVELHDAGTVLTRMQVS